MNIFHSAALKLTLWYLAIIMAVSIVCSVAIYHVSAGDLRRAIARQISYYSQILNPEELHGYSRLRLAQLAQDQNNLKEKLILFNLFVLIGGGGASYGLARKTMRPIEESLEAQSRFTGDASHELRTPLTAMQTEIEVALRNPSLTKSQAVGLLQSNLEEVAKLQILSEGLLQLANPADADDFSQRLSTKELVNESAERVSKIAEARKVKIIKTGANTEVRGSHQYLVDLLAILLDNAIKYSPPSSKVVINSIKRDKSALISISDKGQGIAAQELPRIFERFYRSDRSRNADGYGLGLAIAKKIADLHHATIEVKSAPGKGSTFIVRLNLA